MQGNIAMQNYAIIVISLSSETWTQRRYEVGFVLSYWLVSAERQCYDGFVAIRGGWPCRLLLLLLLVPLSWHRAVINRLSTLLPSTTLEWWCEEVPRFCMSLIQRLTVIFSELKYSTSDKHQQWNMSRSRHSVYIQALYDCDIAVYSKYYSSKICLTVSSFFFKPEHRRLCTQYS